MHKALSLALVVCSLPVVLAQPSRADEDLVHLVPKGIRQAGKGLKWLGKKIVGAETKRSEDSTVVPPPVESTPTLALGTDLNDLVRYDLKILPDAQPILESMQPESPFFKEWFGSGAYTLIALDSKAASPALRAKQRWRGPVAIQAAPLRNQAETERSYVVAAAMLSTSATPEITFRRFKVTLARPGQPNENKVIRVESLATLPNAAADPALPNEVRENEALRADVPASKMIFKISAGQKLRIFLLKDEEHGLRFSYPIGVGGIDQGLDTKIKSMGKQDANLLTPFFENARLDRATIWSHRNDAAHFRNEPFLRVMKDKKAKGAAGWTAVGFHITIMGDGDWAAREKIVQTGLKGADNKELKVAPPEWLTRGYDSHGCMRMRRNDLRFVHDLALTSDRSRVIEVRVGLEAEPEHNKVVEQGKDVMTEYTAWPLEEKKYKRVTAYGAARPGLQCQLGSSFEDGKPRWTCRDNKEHLTIMEQVVGRASDAPVSLAYTIAGISADDRAHLARLFAMAEGRDADPQTAPPPCLEEPCAEPILPNLAETPVLSSDPSLVVDPVPAAGASAASSATTAVKK